MTVDVLPAEATNKEEVTWSISSGTAATIDATSGLLTAVASGPWCSYCESRS